MSPQKYIIQMSPTIKKSTKANAKESLIVIHSGKVSGVVPGVSGDNVKLIAAGKAISTNIIEPKRVVFFCKIDGKDNAKNLENARAAGSECQTTLTGHKVVQIINCTDNGELSLACAEGIALSNYKFTKYLKDKKESQLKSIDIVGTDVKPKAIAEMNILIEAVYFSRDLVNEPQSFLSAVQLSKEIKSKAKKTGYKVDVFLKKKIETLRMGGLLAVNKGSVQPPTFNIIEWKPKKAKNKKPYVLVGKGVVYDTGGLSLKPTPNSMDEMKADMGGSAAVIGAMYAISKSKLPIHVIGLIPATDNRPSLDAYAPGDIITMFDGTTVEVLNTDAEGRLILADALSYAQKYNPELVVDLATLTGSAVRAVGIKGIAAMGSASNAVMNAMAASGQNTYERIAVQPFWDEFGDEIKSDIADLKNIGGDYAGHITAGKFLEHFTKDQKGKHAYPWIHLDIAGPAFIHSKDKYRTKGGTASGVRLLFDFFKQLS